MPSEKEKWLEFHDGQYQFKVQFIPYGVFESILKPVDENYKEKMTQIKKEKKGKTPYTKKISTHVPSGQCLRSMFSYGDVLDLMKMYRGKNCIVTFLEHIEDEMKWLCATFPQQSTTDLAVVLKREDQAAKR